MNEVTGACDEMLSMFYPMFNEADNVTATLREGRAVADLLVAAGLIGSYEQIVIDDASKDDTVALVEAEMLTDPCLRLVRHERNRGLGAGVRSGFAAARGDWVLYTDADLPVDMVELVRALRVARIRDMKLVCAYRLDRTGEGMLRKVYTVGYNTLIRGLFGVRVRDINFAFKLLHRDVVDAVELSSEGSFVDAELVIRAAHAGFEPLQVGLDYFPRVRGESTLASLRTIRVILSEMFGLASELRNLDSTTTHNTPVG